MQWIVMKKMTNYFYVFLSFIRLIKLLNNCYSCYLIEFNVITRYMNLKHEEDFLLVPTPSEASLDPSPSVLQVERGLTCLATVTAPPTTSMEMLVYLIVECFFCLGRQPQPT